MLVLSFKHQKHMNGYDHFTTCGVSCLKGSIHALIASKETSNIACVL